MGSRGRKRRREQMEVRQMEAKSADGVPQPEDVMPEMAGELMRAARNPFTEEDVPLSRADILSSEADHSESSGAEQGSMPAFAAPPPTKVMADIPPPLPPQTSPPEPHVAFPKTRQEAQALVVKLADAMEATRAEDAVHIPEYRRELDGLYAAMMEQEWYQVCVEILKVMPRLRSERAAELFARAHAAEQVGVCSALLCLDSWSFEGHPVAYDVLARWYAQTERPEYAAMLLLKDGLTAGGKHEMKANLRLGTAISDAFHTLAIARSGRMGWHTFFRTVSERPFEIKARLGGSWFEKLFGRWFERKAMPEPFHIQQPRSTQSAAE